MRIAVIGGGILGLTLCHRLSRLGHQVELFEASSAIGGLAGFQSYGDFTWDRFYHCILPQDRNLLAFLDELGLSAELRWTSTGSGYYARSRFYTMSSTVDFLRFPLLSWPDKARLGATVFRAIRMRDPSSLYRITAAEWLTKVGGRRTYEAFWKPLLKAKFGPFHDQVAAVFIWATLTRLFGARSPGTSKEKLGYVSGGYRTILNRIDEVLRAQNVGLHLRTPVREISPSALGGCALTVEDADGKRVQKLFDQVFFTAPTRLARTAVGSDLQPHVARMEKAYPTSGSYLGVLCGVLVLRRPLTPYYVLNIADDANALTGLIEMTNLIDREVETRGKSLVYLPRYLSSEDPKLGAPDAEIERLLIEQGLKRLWPDFEESQILHRTVHRARFVQPLPLVQDQIGSSYALPGLESPFQILNTSMLHCATLNNNEIVGLVDRFVQRNAKQLTPRVEIEPASILGRRGATPDDVEREWPTSTRPSTRP